MLRSKTPIVCEQLASKEVWTLFLLLAMMAFCLTWTGCGALPQSSASTSSQNGSSQNLLPGGAVGSSYHGAFPVGGDLESSQFVVTQGKLPPGLVLNPVAGSVSGTPTQAGTFTFTVSIIHEPGGLTTSHAYTIPVDPCVSCVSVQISPAESSVVAGGKLQFAATVTNTSNTGVTWAATGGSISANGLFTAPTNTSVKSISVTASSVAQTSAHASANITITSSALAITTSSVPSAVESTPYSAALTASGGQAPYKWSIVSGKLPSGLQLNASSGALSGSATQSGTFPFTVQGTDSASHSAQQSLSLLVTSSGKTCGPPAYQCSRTDFDIVQTPGAPDVGNLSGANKVVTDPDFGNRIVRITDANTDTSPTFQNRTFVSSTSGSSDENLWNIDSSLFIVQDEEANTYPFTFDATTMQASRMYASSFPATNGLRLSDGATWSRVNSNILYTYDGTAISTYDFTNRTTPPSPKPVYDFTSSRNCLPAGFTETWEDRGGVSGDDSVFGMTFSNAGNQGTGVYVAVYKAGSGCSLLNTQTGQVSGDWGSKGTINIPDRWTIHNAKISKDGNWMIVVATSCLSSSCMVNPYFWQIGTTNVSTCGMGGNCGGHWTEGYTHWENCDNSPMANQVIRSFYDPMVSTSLTHTFPAGITTDLDQHQSWNNADPADSLPFFSTTESGTSPYPAPWYNEIIGLAADGSGTTWRFAHTFITHRSQNFSAEHAIGSVSQDGRFFMLSSDWMGELGSESGSATCTIGTNCRGDVFVVELR